MRTTDLEPVHVEEIHETDLSAAAEELIRTSSYPALWEVTCRMRQGKLVLRGRVPSYHLKQVAQTLVRNQDTQVDNQICVVEPTF